MNDAEKSFVLIEPVATKHASRVDAVQSLQLVEHEIFERIIFHFLLRRFGSATEITFFKRFERLERLERFERMQFIRTPAPLRPEPSHRRQPNGGAHPLPQASGSPSPCR